MNGSRDRFFLIVGEAFGRDLARPMEWLSLLLLAGWLQFIVTQPEVFALPRYEAFSALPPAAWAGIIAVVLVAQLFALKPTRHAMSIRFVAMALATGIWTIIALTFASSATSPLMAREHGVIALAAFVTAVYLGLKRQG